ncbi:hypothetical protein [Pontibacillus marinus]|uniref:Uncharacterized protein n=1 Tax=Pontibacillus marinus BH030004 = DSM 16465 TaxID=1385511 RepID=A0A0A5GEE2_9BACI|nr:hypothetical protein [Pontibacillus marinus]KGX89578.1 hypothetical protein N783_05355 [Pontibacillus marinus BH030004 = DSM 16465]
MIWLYMLSPLIVMFGIAILVDIKRKKNDNAGEDIDRNKYRDKAYAELERFEDINSGGGGY